jgi:hypothetical protein
MLAQDHCLVIIYKKIVHWFQVFVIWARRMSRVEADSVT